MKGNVGASRHIRYARTPRDGADGHTYGITVTPSCVQVDVNGVPTAAGHIHASPTVTLYRDGEDVTAQADTLRPESAVYAVRRSGVRAKDGVWVERVEDNLTTLGLLGIYYNSVRYDMVPANLPAGSEPPVLASATLVFARQGAQGAQGTVGAFVPPPMLWEDYDGDYEFQPGAEGDTRRDIVLHGSPAAATGLIPSYMCVRNHTRAESREPGVDAGWEADWKLSQSMGFLATRVLLADAANIGLTSTQAVRVYDKTGGIVGEFSGCGGTKPLKGESGAAVTPMFLPLWLGGKMRDDGSFASNPAYAVSAEGKAFFGGFNTGRRVVIDPTATGGDGKVSPKIMLFDANGQPRVTIDGESHGIEQTYGAEATFNAAPTGAFTTVGTESRVLLGSIEVSGNDARLKASVGLDWSAPSAAYTPLNAQEAYEQTIPHVYAELRVRRVTGGAETDMAATGVVLDESGTRFTPGTDTSEVPGQTVTRTKSGRTEVSIDASLTNGAYRLYLVRLITLSPSSAKATVTPSISVVSGTFAHTFTAGSDYKAFLGADSLLVARTATEYFRAGVTEGGALMVEARVGDHGIRVNNGGVYARNRATGTWEAMYVTCETTAADANACVCDQTGQRVFLTGDQTDNLPAGAASKYGAITTVTLNATGGTHIQEFRTLSSPVQCYSRRCLSGTWSGWTKVY